MSKSTELGPILSLKSDGVAYLPDEKKTRCWVIAISGVKGRYEVRVRHPCCEDDILALFAGDMQKECPSCPSDNETLYFRFATCLTNDVVLLYDRID